MDISIFDMSVSHALIGVHFFLYSIKADVNVIKVFTDLLSPDQICVSVRHAVLQLLSNGLASVRRLL